MIRLLIADDEKLEREALAELVQRRFEREVVLEVAENGRKAADTAVLWLSLIHISKQRMPMVMPGRLMPPASVMPVSYTHLKDSTSG